jgi:endonuclease YncB( thermonuclease family)
MRTSGKAAMGVAALVLALSLLGVQDDAPTSGTGDATGTATEAAAPAEPAQPSPAAEPAAAPDAPAEETLATGLLRAADGGDGDSWRDTTGTEYRLGLVNAPETNECYGSTATVERTRLTAGGFRAEVYARDAYGRHVAVVTLADGTNLNVHLARLGFADDRYLPRFRAENPALAAELDSAFAAARAERVGLWGACSSAAAAAPAPAAPAPAAPTRTAPPAAAGCHPDYATCIPVKGDGSGRGRANDLDCASIGQRVQLRTAGVDPYRLDADGDGVGCQSF